MDQYDLDDSPSVQAANLPPKKLDRPEIVFLDGSSTPSMCGNAKMPPVERDRKDILREGEPDGFLDLIEGLPKKKEKFNTANMPCTSMWLAMIFRVPWTDMVPNNSVRTLREAFLRVNCMHVCGRISLPGHVAYGHGVDPSLSVSITAASP